MDYNPPENDVRFAFYDTLEWRAFAFYNTKMG